MVKMTDEELTRLDALVRAWTPRAGEPVINECEMAVLAGRALAELRDLRALLATPTDPVGVEQPEVVAWRDGSRRVAWDLDLEHFGDMEPGEAIGIGAALIRAGQAAKAGAK